MENKSLLQATITIDEIINKDDRIKIKAKEGGTYSFFKTLKDSSKNTMAHQQMQDMGLKPGMSVNIGYDTTPGEYQGKVFQYKNIKTFQESSIRVGESVQPVDKPDWDAISRGKVRHGIVCAMIKAGKSEEEIEKKLSKFTNLVMKEDRNDEKVKSDKINLDDIPF